MDTFEPTSRVICRRIPTNNIIFKTNIKYFLLHIGDANNSHKCNCFPTWARYQLNHTTQFTMFPKTTWIQTKQISCTLFIVICTIDKKITYILHYIKHKKMRTKSFMKPKPNIVMEHLNIYDIQKMCLSFALHLDIYGK